ncbi:MAG: MGMT family protein, partial [Desulfobacterota bacterium]|nr:MGMT family protein [Thermodesulfobacteriota bacterium]
GEVRSYKWISNQLKIPYSFRAVGMALSKNPFPIIVPCHRVVCVNRTLGGFSGHQGILLKQRLLEIEGIKFDNKRKLSKEICYE